jgi:hypothetical protein
MTEQRIVWQMPDGTIRVTIPVDSLLSLDEIAARTQAAAPELRDAKRLPDCRAADLPSRRWRACWRADVAGRPGVDLPLARAQRMAEIRAERDRRLAASDGPMLREQEGGTPPRVEALRAYRQALRELPNELERSGTLDRLPDPADLAAFTPAWPAEPRALPRPDGAA